MPIIHECLHSRSEITNLQTLGSKLIAFSTKEDGIKVVSADNCEVVLDIKNEKINPDTKAIAFSPNFELLAFSDDSYIHIVHISSQKLLNSINSTGEEIEALIFDMSSTYIIAGTKSGRVLQYKYSNNSLLSRLCSFYNPKLKNIEGQKLIGAFALHRDILASGGDSGNVFLINLYSQANKTLLTHGHTNISALCFLNENILISGNINGNLYIDYLKENNKSKVINTTFSKIKQIILMPTNNYIMVIGDKNSIVVIDTKEYKVVNNNYIKFEDKIKKIDFLDDESFVAVLQNNKIFLV